MNELQKNLVNVTLPEQGLQFKETEKRIYILGATEENPVIQTDYPWGRKFRTERAYWIEENKNRECRLCYKTRDPKNGRWCAPKKSTYSSFKMLFIDLETEYVHSTGYDLRWTDIKDLEAYAEKHNDFLPEQRKKEISQAIIIKNKLSERFKQMEEEAKQELEEAKPIDINSKLLWKENELRGGKEQVTAYRVSLEVKGIKKRCRKADFEYLTLGFTSLNIDFSKITTELDSQIRETLQKTFRDVSRAQIKLQKTTFEAGRASNPLMSSMSCNPMSYDYHELLNHEELLKTA